MIELIQAGNKDRELLWNLHQKFLYEMTSYYDNEMDERGNICFGDFDDYFTDPRRSALLIRHDGKGVFAQSVRYCKAFGDVEKGQPLLYDGSSGWLCLDINQGSFMEAYGVETGKDWIVTIRREDNES